MPKKKRSISHLQLTIAPDYVTKWGLQEALRELMQNTIDRQNESAKSPVLMTYDEEARILTLGNENSILEPKSLLLGASPKAGDKNQIGQYGEGYKLAMVVLLREKKYITIDNGPDQWFPRFINSRKFGSKLLEVTVSDGVNENGTSLTFRVSNITPDEFDEFKNRCLHFHENIQSIKTHLGRILTGEDYRGKLYVEGLFVCDAEKDHNLFYGYDIISSRLPLDRDRNAVGGFNLKWATSEMFAFLPREHYKMVYELIDKQAGDVEYFNDHTPKDTDMYREVANKRYESFVDEHGPRAVICKNKSEAEFIKKNHNNLVPIVFNDNDYSLISQSDGFKKQPMPEIPEKTPYKVLKEFIKANTLKINGEDYINVKKFEEKILEIEALDWNYKESPVLEF